jgi:hypothetical protein
MLPSMTRRPGREGEQVTGSAGGARALARSARSFVLGGVVGASAALAARGHRRKLPRLRGGLAAFEDAPCHREAAERRNRAG